MNYFKVIFTGLVAACCLGASMFAGAAQWSSTELQLQSGDLLNPFTDDENQTSILTFQHASGWQYGENFFFIDYLADSEVDGFNDHTYYGELYSTFSAGKILGTKFGGPIRDMGFVMGFNASGEAKVVKYLPGLQVNWEIPGFAFFNTLLTAYIDDSEGVGKDGAPKEDNSFMVDIAWKYPFDIGSLSFSIEGHAEYIDGRDIDESFGGEAESWILAQPQFRLDLGKLLFNAPGQLHAGIEYQYWNNKLGTKEDESTAQFLLVWGL